MTLDSFKRSQKIATKSGFSNVYRSKSNINIKYISLPIALIAILLMTFTLSNTNTSKKAETLPLKHDNTNIETTTTTAINEETCTESIPKYNGYKSFDCTNTNYLKSYECFNDNNIFNSLITKFSLGDQTYLSDGILFREGEAAINGFNSYRILASFNNTKCIVDLTSSIETKDLLYKTFTDFRINEITKESSI